MRNCSNLQKAWLDRHSFSFFCPAALPRQPPAQIRMTRAQATRTRRSSLPARPCDPLTLGRTPKVVAGVVVWLVAEDIRDASGTPVSLWRDRSSAGNSASQPVAAFRPILVARGIHGLPSVAFDGRQSFCVSQIPRHCIGDTAITRSSCSPSFPRARYSQSNAHLNDAPHLFGGRRVGEWLEVRVDGTPEGGMRVSPIVDISDLGQDVIIGQNGNGRPGFQAVQGQIAELVAVSGPISDRDLRSIECYLLDKYGLLADTDRSP